MMTILVTFLLMVFSATGDILMSQKGLDLPDAASKKELRKAPVIAITRDAITFNSGGGGEMMADPSTIDNDSSPQWKIVELFERLKAERKAFDIAWRNKAADDPEKQRCANPNEPKSAADICIVGLLILQADKRTSAKVINRVLKTANAAGYTNLMFAVNRVSSRGG
jgi:biopolymer transport protein ExbD